MNMPIKKLLLVSSIALAMFQSSAVVSAETPKNNSDVRKQAQISTSYALSPLLRNDNINVSVKNGKATLTGKVDESVTKELAEQIALRVNGIDDVDNKIDIEKDYVAKDDKSEPSFGQLVDDATITATVKSKLLWSKYTDGMSTEVDTKAGKVTLKGETENATSKELVGAMASNTRGVVSVDNQLTIQPTDTAQSDDNMSTMEKAGQGISDSWITTKVKSTFMYSSNVNSSNIAVTTDKGNVKLVGKVSSGAERQLAVELASNVRGVKAVDAVALTI